MGVAGGHLNYVEITAKTRRTSVAPNFSFSVFFFNLRCFSVEGDYERTDAVAVSLGIEHRVV